MKHPKKAKKMPASLGPIKEFFSSKFNLILVIAILLSGIFSLFFIGGAEKTEYNGDVVIHYFYLPTCPHCAEQRPIVDALAKEMPELQIIYHDASSQAGSSLFYELSSKYGLDTSKLGVPTMFVNDHPLVGVHTKEQILDTITVCLKECKEGQEKNETKQEIQSGFTDFELPVFGRVDLTKWSLPVLSVILGFVDGFNPCALWVLVFMITLLLGENNNKKIWLVVGSFLLASAVSYFIFMTAWLNLFMVIGYIKLIIIAIGMFALGVGVLHVKEWLTTKGELACKVGNERSHKKTMRRIQDIISKPVTIGLLISVIGLAFFVNAIEFVCSAAIPAVYTQLLALSGISSFSRYMHILLYLFFFMLVQLIIFSMAAFALGSDVAHKYAKYCKLIGGIILVVLGAIMLFAPQLLR